MMGGSRIQLKNKNENLDSVQLLENTNYMEGNYTKAASYY